MTGIVTGNGLIVSLAAAAANATAVIPAGSIIQGIYVQNNTANAITGGLRVGTTNGGAEVVVALAVGANASVMLPLASLLIPFFAGDTTLYVQAVVAWNSANVDIQFVVVKVK